MEMRNKNNNTEGSGFGVKDVSVGGTVLRSAGVTLAVLVLVLALLFGVLFFFAPSFVGNVAAGLGFDGIASSMYYRSYRNGGETEDLARSFELAVIADEYDRIFLCGEELISASDFGEVCIKRDNNYSSEGFSGSRDYESFVYCRTAFGAAMLGREQDTEAVVRRYYLKNADVEYGLSDPMSNVVDAYVENGNEGLYVLLDAELEKRLIAVVVGSDEHKALIVDLYRLYKRSGDTEKAETYAGVYEELFSDAG